MILSDKGIKQIQRRRTVATNCRSASLLFFSFHTLYGARDSRLSHQVFILGCSVRLRVALPNMTRWLSGQKHLSTKQAVRNGSQVRILLLSPGVITLHITCVVFILIEYGQRIPYVFTTNYRIKKAPPPVSKPVVRSLFYYYMGKWQSGQLQQTVNLPA